MYISFIDYSNVSDPAAFMIFCATSEPEWNPDPPDYYHFCLAFMSWFPVGVLQDNLAGSDSLLLQRERFRQYPE